MRRVSEGTQTQLGGSRVFKKAKETDKRKKMRNGLPIIIFLVNGNFFNDPQISRKFYFSVAPLNSIT